MIFSQRTVFLLFMIIPSLLAQTQRIYVGTYTAPGASQGIYALDMDLSNGSLGTPRLVAEIKNPTFLDQSPAGDTLYAGTDFGAGPDGRHVGGVSAFQVDKKSGDLRLLSAQPIAAPGSPCHVSVSPDGRLVAAAQYNAAWVASLPVGKDGEVLEPASIHTHEGTVGPRTDRQDKPHAHSAVFSADGSLVYVCDLGLDEVRVYRADARTGDLYQAGTTKNSTPGAGPRHSRPTADGRFLYVLNELNGSVDVFALSEGGVKLELVQTISSLPVDYKGGNTSAEIRIHPNERFVYASNRGPDLITVYSRDPATGKLSLIEFVSSGGGHPRNFNLSPDGAWLVCANRDSNNLVVFSVSPQTGKLTATGKSAQVPQAVCVLFAR